MSLLDLFLRICFAGFSLLLLAVSIIAYTRYRERRLAFVMLAFLVFALTSSLVMISGLTGWTGFEISEPLLALNIGILVLLYLSLMER